jgi:hypothetical protein
VTDFERLAVAWDLWKRRSVATASGMRVSPLILGMALTSALIAGLSDLMG